MAETLEIGFGFPGNSQPFQDAGWSIRETHGAWMLDGESTLVLPRPEQPGDYLLELDLASLLVPERKFQRLSVRVNGVGVCNHVLRGEAVVQCWVPWSLLAGPPQTVLALSHPDGWSPSEAGSDDTRVLSLYARSASLSLLTEQTSDAGHSPPHVEAPPDPPAPRQDEEGPALHTLVLDFESLGPTCEFGLVQRHFGAEPLGLFRFADTPLAGLLAALEDGLPAAMSNEPASLVLDPDTGEYRLVDRTHGFAWHTGQHDGQADAGALERQEQARLPHLVQRFTETLQDGGKILVLHDADGPADPATIGRLLAALRRHGDATLLWVGAATDGHAPGDVEWAGDGLMRGWVDRLTPRREAVASMAAWGTVCRRAHRLWRAA